MTDTKEPGACETKEDIRGQIDRLDRELMLLFKSRFEYVKRMVELKHGEGLPGRIPARVEEVTSSVRQHAMDAGLDPDLFGGIWRDLIDWNIDYEDHALTLKSSDHVSNKG